MFDIIKEFMAERRLNAANRKIDRNSKRYEKYTPAPAKDVSETRGRSLNQKDTIWLAGDTEDYNDRQARLKREQLVDRFYSGEIPLIASACAVACGAAVVAGVLLAGAVPVNAAAASFVFATVGYSVGSFLMGQTPSYTKTVAASAAVGLVAAAANSVLPGSSAFYLGVGASAVGLATLAGIMGKQNC